MANTYHEAYHQVLLQFITLCIIINNITFIIWTIYGNLDLQSSEKSYKCREDRTKCFYGRFGTRGVYEQLGQEFVNMSDMEKYKFDL